MKKQNQISISAYKSGGFIEKYQKLVKDTVIPYQYSVLCDEADNAEKSHVVQNFANAAKSLNGEDIGDGFYGMVFQDSDAAKWLEAAAYSISLFGDRKIEEDADRLIELIEKAQDEDGYLNTYYTIKDRDKRWGNLLEGHELYCAGHMMEAACAYYEATGKRKLLDVMEKNAEHIYDVFIRNGHEGYPGHPEIELALMKMYRLTGNEHCLDLAKHFIDVRGVDNTYFKREAAARDWSIWGSKGEDGDYQQSSKPVREQQDATGHAVRAVYLYTGMADLGTSVDDEELMKACRRLWKSIVERRMYITGGIGSTVHGEAFSVDYDLPSDTAYAETCASIGLMFFASRMLEYDINREYADVMELAFYNTVLAGIQLDGKRFFYVNPLEVIPGISGVSPTHKHDLPQRPGWYACACCPPNVARLISSFGKYAYGENTTTAFLHMFADGEVKFDNGTHIKCRTSYPYSFEVDYEIISGHRLAIRIPAWSKEYKIIQNGRQLDTELEKGYAYIDVNSGDELKIILDESAKFVYASSKIPELTGKAAIMRGPLVYCFEGVDNDSDVISILLDAKEQIQTEAYNEALLGGIVELSINAQKTAETATLYSYDSPEKYFYLAKAVPYYTWGNRGINQMRVWMPGA